MPGYQGCRISNVSPWDAFPDPRVQIGRYQEGEFFFCRKYLPWNTIARRKAAGFYMNTEHLKGGAKDFATHGDTSQLVTPQSETLYQGDGEEDMKEHPATVTVYEGSIEIIPSEWKLGDSDYPEKWMFTITGDLATLIGVQPHGAMHCKHPFGVIETEVEAYGTYNRGFRKSSSRSRTRWTGLSTSTSTMFVLPSTTNLSLILLKSLLGMLKRQGRDLSGVSGRRPTVKIFGPSSTRSRLRM